MDQQSELVRGSGVHQLHRQWLRLFYVEVLMMTGQIHDRGIMLNFHVVASSGTFAADNDGRLVFFGATKLDNCCFESLTEIVRRRILRYLVRHDRTATGWISRRTPGPAEAVICVVPRSNRARYSPSSLLADGPADLILTRSVVAACAGSAPALAIRLHRAAKYEQGGDGRCHRGLSFCRYTSLLT